MVYPEKEDVGKPKVFARQSFIVSGEEEEMAETILQARAIGETKRRIKTPSQENVAFTFLPYIRGYLTATL